MQNLAEDDIDLERFLAQRIWGVSLGTGEVSNGGFQGENETVILLYLTGVPPNSRVFEIRRVWKVQRSLRWSYHVNQNRCCPTASSFPMMFQRCSTQKLNAQAQLCLVFPETL